MNDRDQKRFLHDLDRRRRNLGMTWDALGARSGVSRATLCRLLKEQQTAASFHSVIAVAEALGVIVQFDGVAIHANPLDVDDFLEQQADRQARKLVGMVQGTMGLESQALPEQDMARLVKKTTRKLLAGPKKQLWYE